MGGVYLDTSHDENVTLDNFFTMNDWRLYFTVDMVNWTDHRSPLGYKDFSRSSGKAWGG
jgi:arabinoxylan arabinofuranohydrolase